MRQQTLFEQPKQDVPLATRMRPRTLEEFVGQTHLLSAGKVLRQLIEEDRVSSMIFWGPPGVGKTTLARIIAGRTKANFINFSAVTSSIKEIREVMNEADHSAILGERTLLFVDEIHRFNKAQLENGSWAPTAAKTMKKLLEGSKNLAFTETMVTVKSALSDESRAQIEALAAELC